MGFLYSSSGLAQDIVVKDAIRILRDECVSCHRPGKAKGGLLLHDPVKMAAGGDSGPSVVPGKPDESYLLEVLYEEGDPHMPPKKQLSDTQIAQIKAWIQQGAKWDASVFDEAPPAKPIPTTALPAGYHPIFTLTLSPDGKLLAVARGSQLLLINTADPKFPVLKKAPIPVAPISSVAWSPDGKRLFIGSVQRIYQWNWESSEQVEPLIDGLLGPINAIAVDESNFLWIGDGPIAGAGFIRKVNLQNRKIELTLKGHEDLIYSLALSPDKKSLLSSSADKYVKRWDLKNAKIQAIYEGHTNHVISATFNADGSQLASASADREIKLWNTETRLQESVLGNKKFPYADLDWSRDGTLLAVITDHGAGNIYSNFVKHTGLQRSESAQQRALTPVKESLATCVFSADGKTLFGGAASGTLHIWNTANGKLMHSLPLQ